MIILWRRLPGHITLGGWVSAALCLSPSTSQSFWLASLPYLRLLPSGALTECSWPGRLATVGSELHRPRPPRWFVRASCSMSRFIRAESHRNKVGSWPGGTASQSWAQSPPPTSAHPPTSCSNPSHLCPPSHLCLHSSRLLTPPRPHLGDDGDPGPQRVQPHLGMMGPADPDPASQPPSTSRSRPQPGRTFRPCPANNAHLG